MFSVFHTVDSKSGIIKERLIQTASITHDLTKQWVYYIRYIKTLAKIKYIQQK